MQNSGVFGALSDQVLKIIVDFTKEGLDENDPIHPKLFKQVNTTHRFIRRQSIAPFGTMLKFARPCSRATAKDFAVLPRPWRH